MKSYVLIPVKLFILSISTVAYAGSIQDDRTSPPSAENCSGKDVRSARAFVDLHDLLMWDSSGSEFSSFNGDLELVNKGTSVSDYQGVLANPIVIPLAFGLCLRGLYCQTNEDLNIRNAAEIDPLHLDYEFWIENNVCEPTSSAIISAHAELRCVLGQQEMVSFCESSSDSEGSEKSVKGRKSER